MKVKDHEALKEDIARRLAEYQEMRKRFLYLFSKRGGRVSREEAALILQHLERLIELEQGRFKKEWHEWLLSSARAAYNRGEKTPQVTRLRAMARALGFEDGKRGRNPNPEARWMLLRFNRLRENHSYVDTLEIIAREFEIRGESKDADPLRTAEKQIERAKKANPDLP